MNFYHILFALKQGFNRNLTWYENLFVKFYNNTIAKLTARILRIKGNTVSFNQLVSEQQSHTFTANVSNQTISFGRVSNIIAGHKYAYLVTQANSMASNIRNTMQYLFLNGSGNETVNESSTVNHNLSAGRYAWVFTAPSNNANDWISLYYWCHTPDVDVTVKNPMLFDLTLMGIDNLTTTAEVEQWLSTHIGDLPYFDYTQGTLISFNGSGLKTVGFNQWDEEWEVGSLSSGNPVANNNSIRSKNYCRCLPNTTYYCRVGIATTKYFISMVFYDADHNYISQPWCANETITSPSNAYYFKIRSQDVSGEAYGNTYLNDICINISDASKNGTYEPYTSNTLSLPISTYFPTGMKSAGSVYDELSDKAYTRIGSVDLGTLAWGKNVDGQFYTAYAFADTKSDVEGTNVICSKYINGNAYDGSADKTVCIYNRIWIKDSNYTDSTSFKNAMSGVMLYYELATPAETSISPELDLTYPIQWGGTEQILPVNTSTPTTSGIVADIKYPDGIRYDQTFVYRVIEKATQLGNRALSIMLGKKVETDNPEEPLDILLKGEK